MNWVGYLWQDYPLVNVYITNWKDPAFYSWVNPRTKSAMFKITFWLTNITMENHHV